MAEEERKGKEMSRTQGYKTPYKGGIKILKRLFAYADKERLTNDELAELIGVSGYSVSGWRNGKYMPIKANRELILRFLNEYDKEEERMTLVDVKPPKDKRDGEIFTYRTDTPWKKETEKKEEIPAISEEELIEYAIKGMPEDVRNALLKRMLTERNK